MISQLDNFPITFKPQDIKTVATDWNLSKENFFMFVMIGLPGSGKDTYIKQYLSTLPVICRDDIREKLYDNQILGRKLYLTQEMESKVTDIVNQSIEKFSKEKQSFVINQTSLKKRYRESFAQIISKFNKPKVVYIHMDTPLEECIKRRGGGKWIDIITKMQKDFEYPTSDEYDELVTVDWTLIQKTHMNWN